MKQVKDEKRKKKKINWQKIIVCAVLISMLVTSIVASVQAL